jgi:hypothetical protein
MLLPFHRDLIHQLSHQDGLVILGRGLGIQHVWAGFLAQYLQVLPSPRTSSLFDATSATTPPSNASPHLVFLLNFDENLLQWMNEAYQTHYHPHGGSEDARDAQQFRSRGIRQINNEFSVPERSTRCITHTAADTGHKAFADSFVYDSMLPPVLDNNSICKAVCSPSLHVS